MGNIITIKEGDMGRSFAPQKLQTRIDGGGIATWVKKSDVTLGTKYINKNGVYRPDKEQLYGYSRLNVNVVSDYVVGKKNGVPYKVSNRDGDLVYDELPTEIRVTTPPIKTNYREGNTIDLTGLVVTAYRSNGTIWTHPNYPNGIIPNGELYLTDLVARKNALKVIAEYKGIRYLFNVYENGTYLLAHADEVREPTMYSSTYRYVYNKWLIIPPNRSVCGVKHIYEEDGEKTYWRWIIFASSDPLPGTSGTWAFDDHHVTGHIYNSDEDDYVFDRYSKMLNTYTYDLYSDKGKRVYYVSGYYFRAMDRSDAYNTWATPSPQLIPNSSWFPYQEAPAIFYDPDSSPAALDRQFKGSLAWEMVYGIRGIPICWPRYGDSQILETIIPIEIDN